MSIPDVIPFPGIMGAEIQNVDLADPLSDGVFARIARAFLDHKLLVFRNQALSPVQIQAFAERFGPIEVHTVRRPDGGVLEGVHAVTNLDANGKPAQKPHINANYYWHSDKAHYPAPALLSMLFAVELPPNGGETEFANMTIAYERLPAETKRQIEGLRVENDFEYAMANVGKTLTDAEREATPPVTHPIVRTHPETRGKSLFVGMYSKAVVGMPDAQGKALIKQLLDFATQPEFTFRHQWRVGDLVVWDNRCLNHRAVMNYEMTQHRRVLLRCVVRGSVPA
jgi:alpha-ketoglutarate-dependent taurine dioxygenase